MAYALQRQRVGRADVRAASADVKRYQQKVAAKEVVENYKHKRFKEMEFRTRVMINGNYTMSPTAPAWSPNLRLT